MRWHAVRCGATHWSNSQAPALWSGGRSPALTKTWWGKWGTSVWPKASSRRVCLLGFWLADGRWQADAKRTEEVLVEVQGFCGGFCRRLCRGVVQWNAMGLASPCTFPLWNGGGYTYAYFVSCPLPLGGVRFWFYREIVCVWWRRCISTGVLAPGKRQARGSKKNIIRNIRKC